MEDFSKLYDKHIKGLFAFGSRIMADREALKDCIQDVFVKLYTRKEGLGAISNIESYLYISLRNRIHDEFRRNGKITGDEVNDANMQAVAEYEEYNQEQMEQQQELTNNVEKFFTKGKRKYLMPLDKKIRKLILPLAQPYPKEDANWQKVDRSKFNKTEEQ